LSKAVHSAYGVPTVLLSIFAGKSFASKSKKLPMVTQKNLLPQRKSFNSIRGGSWRAHLRKPCRYKKKLEERERMKELERLEEEKEAREDVTKTQDFSGFYRNILASQVGGSGRGDHLASGDTIDPSRLPESQANALKEFQDSKRAHSHETSKDAESPSTTVSHAPAIAVHADEEIDLDGSKERQSSETTSEATQRVEVHKSIESTPHESKKELGDAELNVIQKITGSRYTGQLDKEERNTESQSTAERKTQETEIEAAKRRALERRKKS
jgi:hypothetical protein